MKTRLEIFSSEKLQNFFSNLDIFFNISIKSLNDLKDSYDSKNLSIVFFEDKDFDPAKIDQSISDHTQAKNATKMLGDWQLNHYILQPWHFIEIELEK